MLQVVNYNHMMPTRYSVDISFDKANINKELLKVTHDKEMDCYCPESRTRARATSQQGSHVCCWVRVARASRDSEQCCNEYSDSDSDSNLFLRIPNIRIRIRDFFQDE